MKQILPTKSVTVYSDGACEGNPGPGGWAAVLSCGDHTRELSGGEPATTNNRMELQAAIEALRALNEPCCIEFFTDSVYLRDGITSWIAGWKQRGWLTADKKPVKNADLWRALDALVGRHELVWRWVKGHAGNHLNERCDQLAVAETGKIKQQFTPEQLKTLLAEFQEREKASNQLTLL